MKLRIYWVPWLAASIVGVTVGECMLYFQINGWLSALASGAASLLMSRAFPVCRREQHKIEL